jgi:hypothetical protein
MITDYQIAEPILFNPLKHHLGFIKEYLESSIDTAHTDEQILLKELRHIGTSVMDVYTGPLSVKGICRETMDFLMNKNISCQNEYSVWILRNVTGFHITELSDGSRWTLNYNNNSSRYVHIFPARNSPHTFRVKANTMKSALIYSIIIGKDLVTGYDLNKVRPLLNLSPVKDPIDTEAILEMIEILRK